MTPTAGGRVASKLQGVGEKGQPEGGQDATAPAMRQSKPGGKEADSQKENGCRRQRGLSNQPLPDLPPPWHME